MKFNPSSTSGPPACRVSRTSTRWHRMVAQGTLQLLWELEQALAEISGMVHLSPQPEPTAN